ncbi:hypothetical protein Patl1_00596 [Pistacia atlantica]|uniref:Uncharacterized protein n=1 Tax=Pistacia atlantica TaxID=434234 RepID=A0ACC1C717_9ROSI|nr:hypothetical protein Patl1_00596 [Pistacia atlantica]
MHGYGQQCSRSSSRYSSKQWHIIHAEMAVSPTSVASSGHFPFTASDMSGMGVDTCALDTTFTSDVASTVGLQLGQDGGPGNSRDSLRSLDQIQWIFSLSDLTADLSNLGGMFWIQFSAVVVEDFFVDSVPGPPCSQSDEEKS